MIAKGPKRSLPFGWKLIQVAGTWVGVDTGLAVPLVEEALRMGHLPALSGYPRSYREVPYGRDERSRIDILLSRGGELAEETDRKSVRRVFPTGDQRVYVEVKNTTLVHGGTAMFPDAVTERGQKHLRN